MWIKISGPLTDILRGKQTKASLLLKEPERIAVLIGTSRGVGL